MNKFLVISLTFLGVFTVFCAVQSCGNSKSQIVKFVNPPSVSEIWSSDFVAWPVLPIRVRVDGPMWAHLTEDADRAISYWNGIIGCEVFASSRKDGAEVQISMQPQPDGTTWAGSHTHLARTSKNGDKYWGSDIHIHVLHLNNQVYRDNVMSHEFGHVLSLNDLDTNSNLVMYKNVNPGMEVPFEVLSTLKSIYCER